MQAAQIVPLRRLPADHEVLDYLVPAGRSVTLGQVVTIPLRLRQQRGVVWGLSTGTAQPRLRPLGRAHDLVLTDWQRQVSRVMSEQGATSLGHILATVIPSETSRRSAKLTTNRHRVRMKPGSFPVGLTWWYRQRGECLTWIAAWVSATNRPRIILTPTIDDAHQIHDHLQTLGFSGYVIHADLTPAAYRRLYQQVALDQTPIVIGTLRALTLPFHRPPSMLIDQEEHPAHKQTARHPRLDARRVAQQLDGQTVATSPAPSIGWYAAHRPTPPSDSRSRQVTWLRSPGSRRWLSGQTVDALTQALADHRPAVCITPRRGFARSIDCGDCGWMYTCPNCHQPLAMSQARVRQSHCRFCGHTSTLPDQCPRCQGHHWSFHGLGPEQLVQEIGQQWPRALAVPLTDPKIAADVFVGSYRAYRLLPDLRNLATIILISGDSLLNVPDYSSAERAWQYLNRLQAAAPETPLIVQTFDPDHEFWQRWLAHDDYHWYQAELETRRRLGLPPSTEQWIAHYRGADAAVRGQTMLARLQRLRVAGLEVHSLTQQATDRIPTTRLLLSMSPGQLARRVPWRQWFDLPWQLDTSPASWLD